jgi:hypothetical protein
VEADGSPGKPLDAELDSTELKAEEQLMLDNGYDESVFPRNGTPDLQEKPGPVTQSPAWIRPGEFHLLAGNGDTASWSVDVDNENLDSGESGPYHDSRSSPGRDPVYRTHRNSMSRSMSKNHTEIEDTCVPRSFIQRVEQ